MKLHDHAVAASKELEQLATGLAQSNAPDKTVKAFTQMADACRQLGSALSRAPSPQPQAPADKTSESLNGAAASYGKR